MQICKAEISTVVVLGALFEQLQHWVREHLDHSGDKVGMCLVLSQLEAVSRQFLSCVFFVLFSSTLDQISDMMRSRCKVACTFAWCKVACIFDIV